MSFSLLGYEELQRIARANLPAMEDAVRQVQAKHKEACMAAENAYVEMLEVQDWERQLRRLAGYTGQEVTKAKEGGLTCPA